jgi:myosin regulatory light chain 12
MFTSQQVKQFKEAFNMIDQDGDGRITDSDLKIMLSNLGQYIPLTRLSDREKADGPGQTPSPALIKSLLTSRADTSSGVNFTQFLSMMGEHLIELDPEHDILEAFACFDEGDKGWVDVREMRKWLSDLGDPMTEQEVRRRIPSPFTAR